MNEINIISSSLQVYGCEDIALLTASSIIEYGNEITEEIKNVSQSVNAKIETKSDNKSLLTSLNTILNTIDYNELKSINERSNNLLSRAMNYITKSRDKLMVKYIGIADGLDKMYFSIKKYQNNLSINNDALRELQGKMGEIITSLRSYIEEGKRILPLMQEETMEDLEKKNLMVQKVQDLEYTQLTCEQTLDNISIMLKTNYTIYRKLISVYNTTTPIIQNQINIFRIAKEHSDMVSQLQIIDQKRDELIKLTASESVKLAKNSTELLGYSVESFNIVKKAIFDLRQGMEEIVKLEQDKVNEIRMLEESNHEII